MNAEEFDKAIQELDERIDEEGVKVVENDEKRRMASLNQFWERFVHIVTFSMIAYVAVLFLSMVIGREAFTGLINLYPHMILPLQVVFAGVSVGLGITCVNLLTDWYNVKERINAFSKAESEKEKLKEEIKYTWEEQKVLKKAEILREVQYILEQEKKKIESLSRRYNVNVAEKKYNDEGPKYDKKLKDLYAKLDQLLAKKVLNVTLGHMNSKLIIVSDCILHFFMGGGLCWLIMTFPFITVANYFASLGQLVKWLFMAVPFAIGSSAIGGMYIKRTIDKIEAFKELNDELEASLTTSDLSLENIDEKIEEVTSDIIQTEVYKLYDERGKDEKEPELIGEEMYLSLERNIATPTTVLVEEKPLVRARKNRLG